MIVECMLHRLLDMIVCMCLSILNSSQFITSTPVLRANHLLKEAIATTKGKQLFTSTRIP